MVTIMVFTDDDLKTIQERIHSKTVQLLNGCHKWEGSFNSKDGRYPLVYHKRKAVSVVLFNYRVKHGVIVPRVKKRIFNDERICNDDKCVNPDHYIDDFSSTTTETWQRILKITTKVGDCIIWNISNNRSGTGAFRGVTYEGHRLSFMLNKNNGEPIPKRDSDGNPLVIRHTCTTKFCVNPDHLELGTMAQNMFEDRIRDGTINRGEKHHASKITEELAQEIKLSRFDKWEEGYKSQTKRAAHFDVSKYTVNSIDSGEAWGYLPDKNGETGSDRRIKARAWRIKAKEKTWSKQDYENVMKKIKKNVIYNNDNKKDLSVEGFCWEWQKFIHPRGYGVISFLGLNKRVHICACEAKYGRHRIEGELTRHLCGNTLCCNPQHLVFGTPYENNMDTLKHRSNKRLRFEVQDIINIRKSSETSVALAEKYGTTSRYIKKILSRGTWKHIN